MTFASSRLKVKRANKHISNVGLTVRRWLSSNFYVLSVYKKRRKWWVRCVVVKPFPAQQLALLVGDALHNLRSSLDILYFQISACPSKYTRFPIRDTREELESSLLAALEKKQISGDVFKHMLETVQPYKAGNFPLWALDEMNIIDKHKLLIPVVQFLAIEDVCFEDEEGADEYTMSLFPFGDYVSKGLPFDVDILDFDHPIGRPERRVTLKYYGHPTASIFFDDAPFTDKSVVPALSGIAEEVSRTIESFELLLG